MRLGVKLFARAKEVVGRECIEIDLPDAATVADLRAALAEQCPDLSPMVPNLLIAIGTNYATDSTPLSSRAEIACFPPVSGG